MKLPAAREEAALPYPWRLRQILVRSGPWTLRIERHRYWSDEAVPRRGIGHLGPGSRAHLVFQREGRAIYLTQAWFTGADEYVGAAKLPKRDVEYANTAAQVSHIEVASAR